MESRKSFWIGSSWAERRKQEMCVQAGTPHKSTRTFIKAPEPSCTNSIGRQTFCHRRKEGSKVSQQAVCLATEEVATFKVKVFPLRTAKTTSSARV